MSLWSRTFIIDACIKQKKTVYLYAIKFFFFFFTKLRFSEKYSGSASGFAVLARLAFPLATFLVGSSRTFFSTSSFWMGSSLSGCSTWFSSAGPSLLPWNDWLGPLVGSSSGCVGAASLWVVFLSTPPHHEYWNIILERETRWMYCVSIEWGR